MAKMLFLYSKRGWILIDPKKMLGFRTGATYEFSLAILSNFVHILLIPSGLK